MSEPKSKSTKPADPKKFGWMAEYTHENDLLTAARKVRDSGYTKTDAYTPFPVHGIDDALGIKPTILPFIVLCAGLTGLLVALTMQIWMNAIDYKYIISGKPFYSIPAFIPVAFELTILFSAFTTFLGMMALNKLPTFSNPVFTNPRFDRATNDRFFLHVDASDKYYNSNAVHELLNGTTPESLEEVVEDATPAKIPRFLFMAMLLVIAASFSPAMIILIMRNTMSESPRFHVFFDMDFQPKKKPQQTTTIFADGRTMRPQVQGTVGRGQLSSYDSFDLGYEPGTIALLGTSSENRFVSMQDQEGGKTEATGTEDASEVKADATDGESKSEEPPADAVEQPEAESAAPAAEDAAAAGTTPTLNFLTTIPIDVTEANMELGKQKFTTYCSACHGLAGDGNGLVAQRADQLAQGYWIPPTSLHDPRVRDMPVGQIFYTIGNGKGKMAGYGPSITPEERWAIAMYVEALQLSRNADLSELSDAEKSAIEKPATEKPATK
jgi:mono/diheme cytochrome c family protein